MKKTLQALLGTLHSNVPDIPFEIRFWDGHNQKVWGCGTRFYPYVQQKEGSKEHLQQGLDGLQGRVCCGRH